MNEAKMTIAKERVSRLFRFMASIQQLSAPPALLSRSYSWKLNLADLPTSKYVQLGKVASGDDEIGDDFLLRVRKPNEKKDPGNALFDKLLDLNGNLERESERLELVVGDGIISSPAHEVDHPVLLQKLTLEFIAETPEFIIRETDREGELYAPVLRKMGLDETFIAQWKQNLQSEASHPLGGDDTSRFLVDLQQAMIAALNTPVKVTRGAFFYLGPRSAAFTQAIEAYLGSLPHLSDLPSSLVRVVGVEPDVPSAVEEGDLLLTMPSNPEQDRVAKRLSQTGAVLVQGPPGTGKTHTIANLIGHLLAQGKSVLVTSHASKALRIVRDMVIPELRPLCVSVLDQESESKDQLEAAVKGIVHRLTNSDPEELENLAADYVIRRHELREKLEYAERRLLEVRSDEYKPLVIGDDSIHPARAAQLLVDPTASSHNWLPGPLVTGAELPLTPEEVTQLYKLNREVPLELEADLAQDLPPLEKLIPDYQFKDLVNKKQELHTDDVFGEEFWEHESQDSKQLQRLLEIVDRALAPINEGTAWMLDCCRVSMLGGAHRQMWEDLVSAIESSTTELSGLERKIVATGASIDCDLPVDEQIRTINEIIAHLKNKGSISFWTLFGSNWKKLIGSCRIHGKTQPRTVEECEGVLACIQLDLARTALQSRWDRQMGTKGAPAYANLGEPAYDVAYSYLPQIKASLAWYENEWDKVRRLMKEVGLRWSAMVDRVGIDTGLYGELFRIREAVRKYLIPTIQSRRSDLDSSVYDQRLKAQEQLLQEYAPKDLGGILGRLRQATMQLDVEAYARAWAWFSQLQSLEDPARRRNLLMSKLEPLAPAWVEGLRAHRQPHDRGDAPGDAVVAWKFRQWIQQLEERSKLDPDQLQQEVIHLRSQLRLATAQYVEHKTWANQLRRTGVKQQQALIGWLDLMRKIGTGKGKRAPKLKATARQRLAECRDAVPVWIMPLARVAESYHPGESRFDVVILDEASQSDVTGLLAFALGKEVLVVGDNEQVSPEAVGMSYEKVEALISEHLYDIPNKELYDGKTSVYDLARQSFGGTIRLVEHFRCVPEIIAFSNRLCYQGEIQPLRDDSKVTLRPPTRFHPVAGGNYARRINRVEAEEVASLLISCAEQPEYRNQTFGVISLVGEEQAQAIDKLLTTHMALSDYQERRVLCGNAAQFQGDERDVMFLATVETPEESGALTMRRTDVFIKRYNVAASRARNQLWVVSCLDPETDLKPGDLREVLIRHAQNPQRTLTELADMQEQQKSYDGDVAAFGSKKVATALEEHLKSLGYKTRTNFAVGNYRLDMVVEGPSGRVAIKVDGDSENAPERFKLAVDREAVLERLGWRFLRLRASQYYLRPENTLKNLVRRLEMMGIEPFRESNDVDLEARAAELYERVMQRADQLRRQWRGEEPVNLASIEVVDSVEFQAPQELREPRRLEPVQTPPPAFAQEALASDLAALAEYAPEIMAESSEGPVHPLLDSREPVPPTERLAQRLEDRLVSITQEPSTAAPPLLPESYVDLLRASESLAAPVEPATPAPVREPKKSFWEPADDDDDEDEELSATPPPVGDMFAFKREPLPELPKAPEVRRESGVLETPPAIPLRLGLEQPGFAAAVEKAKEPTGIDFPPRLDIPADTPAPPASPSRPKGGAAWRDLLSLTRSGPSPKSGEEGNKSSIPLPFPPKEESGEK